MRALVACMLVAPSLVACSSSPSLRVDLRTDLVPGLEFNGVVTTLEDGTSIDHVVTEQDYFVGVQVSRFDGLDNGLLRFSVQLTNDGAPVVERQVNAEVRGTTGVTALVTRDCRFVSCPDEGGDPTLTACVGGRCVDPGCTDERPELCAMVCEAQEECPGVAECARSVCEGVACTVELLPDACPAARVCDPIHGCVDPACGFCGDSNACTADDCVDGTCTHAALDGNTCGPGTCELDRCVVNTGALASAALPFRPSAVTVAGSFAAVGMMEMDTVQLFQLVDGAWIAGSALSTGDDGFGCHVSMRGDLLAVGSCADVYSVSLFRKVAGDYVFEDRFAYADIVPTVDETLAIFRPIAVGDEIVVVGVALDPVGGGVAVVENDGSGNWSQTDFLEVPGEPSLGFGLDVNERIVAGAPGDAGEPGTVFIFERGPGGFEEIHRVSAPDAVQLGSTVWAPSPQFMRARGETAEGTAVFKIDQHEDEEWGFSALNRFDAGGVLDVAGPMSVVGRPTEDVGGISEAGFAELFYFGLRVTLREPFPTAERRFGTTVATDGVTMLVAPFPMDIGMPTQVTFVSANDLESTGSE